MAHDFKLHGGGTPVALGGGYTLRTPGLSGTARVMGPRAPGTRGPELASPALDQALQDAGMEEIKAIELAVNPAPFPAAAAPLRGPEGGDAFELEVPDLGADTGQVVLSVDEAGAMHWHFPLDEALAPQPAATRGAGAVKRFRIPREVASPPPAAAAQAPQRSLVSLIGRKVLKVLIYPVGDALLGPVVEAGVSWWEGRKRPHRLSRFLPGDRSELTGDDWARLAGGRALLWVHGTFSTSRAGFGGLPADTLAQLAQRYGDRLFAFDHPSISVTPLDNVRWFFSQLPAGIQLDLDIVCHSRGGLVSRLLALATPGGGDPARFQVRRLVLAGVPNEGTLLADPDHMVEFLDRLTTALNMTSATPDWTDVLEGILTVVKVIGHAGLHRLDGLDAMRPGTASLATLNAQALAGTEVYGIGADFQARGSGLAAAFCLAADSLLDRAFRDAPNDLVVPSLGMSAWAGKLQIPDERFLRFAPEQAVWHTKYFEQPQTSTQLLRWLA